MELYIKSHHKITQVKDAKAYNAFVDRVLIIDKELYIAHETFNKHVLTLEEGFVKNVDSYYGVQIAVCSCCIKIDRNFSFSRVPAPPPKEFSLAGSIL